MKRPLFVALALVSCGPPVEGDRDARGADDEADARSADAMPPAFDGNVYVHSYVNLYAVDPETLELSLIDAFGWPAETGDDMMTDIAVDQYGEIVGISFGALYAVDKETAECTFLTTLAGQSFNGLSYLPRGDGEVLIGTGLAGEVWEIDPQTGEATLLGDFGGAIESSGDIVSVSGFGTVATVKNGSLLDYLARVDETTGAATIIGPTGYADIWGVGYWRNKVYGFVATNELVLIDVDTGEATYVSTGPENWTGGGVTTRAPIVP